MLASYRVFLSCVSVEFLGYRNALRTCLTSPGRDIKVQEDFNDGGGTLLEKLDDYILSCQAMIHLIGLGCGSKAKPAEVRAILARYPDLPTAMPELTADLVPAACPFTYTQWEAFLAIYHRVPCFIYRAGDTSRREAAWVEKPGESAEQDAHVGRLRSLGKDRWMLPFADERDVAIRFLSSIISPISDEAPSTTPSTIAWPATPTKDPYPLADRHDEFDTFLKLVTGQSRERIYMISGPSDRGKTVLLGQFESLAKRLPGLHCARVEFKNSLPLHEALYDLTRELAPLRFPRFNRELDRRAEQSMRTAFIEDLEEAQEPVLLILDTYEQATEETRLWIENRFLPLFKRRDGLRLVLAGQTVPEINGHAWEEVALPSHELPPITEAHHWCDYSYRVMGLSAYSPDQIGCLVTATFGSPRSLGTLLNNLKFARS